MNSTNTTSVIIIAIFACIVIAAFIVYRKRGKINIRGPLGTGLEIDASNETKHQATGIKADGVVSQSGKVQIIENTGQGIESKDIFAKQDVLISSNSTPVKSDESKNPSISAQQLAAQRDNIIVMGNLLQPASTSEVPNTEKIIIKHNLPQPQYGIFIGREGEIAQIINTLRPYPQSNHALVTIDGVGGIGKSALALEVAHRYLRNAQNLPDNERFDALVWVSAKTETLIETIVPRYKIINTLDGILKAIAEVLSSPEDMEKQAITLNLVISLLTKNRTLLIIDNLETIEDSSVFAFLREFPAPTKIIVTTRRRIDVAYPIRLLGMPEHEAKRLIGYECEKRTISLTSDEIHRVFERTGGIPLAIVWSMAQLGTGKTFENILRDLGNPTGNLARFCFEKVMESIRGKPSHKLLMALSLFENGAWDDDIGYVSDLPQIDFEKGLEELEVLSLINRDKDSNYYRMLPLTREYAQAELQQLEKLHDFLVYRRERWKNKDSVSQDEATVTNWLSTRSVTVQNYRRQDEADIEFDRLAIFLGERYENLKTLLSFIRKNISTGRSFRLKLESNTPLEISDVTQFCLLLQTQGLLLSYKYFRPTRTVQVSPCKDVKAIEFFTGGWFVRFIQLKVISFLEQSSVENANFISNLQIKMSDDNVFGIDLFFIINSQPVCIKVKTGQYDEKYIERYSTIHRLLSIPDQRAVLVILSAPTKLLDGLSSRHKLVVANENNFLQRIEEAIASPEATLSQINTYQRREEILSSTPHSLYTLLNRFSLRPFPEHRISVLKTLIEIMDGLEYSKTMSEIKLMLSEKLPISKSQLQDIMNAVVRSGCVLDEKGVLVLQFIIPVKRLISSKIEVIEDRCIEYYIRTILTSIPNFFSTPSNIKEYERTIGTQAPSSEIIQSIKRELNLE
jgi:hypothetical protein